MVLPSARPVRVFVTDARLERFPLYAAAIREHQAISPTIWLVTGDPFAGNFLGTVSDGAAQSTLLNRSGVDAVIVTPEWLSFGLPRVNEMVAKGRYYSLSANLLDTAGQTIGYPFMVRKSGSAVLAVTGLALDSVNVLRYLNGVRYVAPALAAGKTMALMRQRADLVGVMVDLPATGSSWGADFAVNMSSPGEFAMTASVDTALINCYDLNADASHLTARTTELQQTKPDTAVVRLLDSIRTAADSLAARSIPSARVPLDAQHLSSMLVQGMLSAKLADGFLCDSLFVADFREPKDVGSLVSVLRDPGRLAILVVRDDVLAGMSSDLVVRAGVSLRAKSHPGLTYRIATTVDYLQRHPQLARAGFELMSRPFWTICLDILESGQGK